MKLLFLEQHPRFVGGSERMSLALCEHAIARGHEVSLVHVDAGDMLEAYRRAGASCHQLPILPFGVRRPRTAWRSFDELRTLARGERTDILFTSQIAYVPLIALVARSLGIRSAAHLGLPLGDSHPVTHAGRYLLDLGVAPSGHTAGQLTARGWRARTLQVIQNGVNTATFRPGDREAARSRQGLAAGARPLVAYVGRLVAEKGVHTLVSAFARYRRNGGRGDLLFVGVAPGKEVEDLRATARREGLADESWSIRPATSTPEEIYRAADLVVVPSEWDEPFGLVPIEAAACGTLTIVSNRGVLPDLVAPLGGHGTFPSGSVDALQQRLAYWLEDEGRRERSAETLTAYVRTHFSFERCGDAYLDAFRSLLEPGRRTPAEARTLDVRVPKSETRGWRQT